MRKVVQKAIIQVIQPEIVEFYCDDCGKRTGTKENPKSLWHSAGKTRHYCRRTCGPSSDRTQS